MDFIKRKLNRFELNPPRVLALGFGSLIIIGAILLNLPIATKMVRVLDLSMLYLLQHLLYVLQD